MTPDSPSKRRRLAVVVVAVALGLVTALAACGGDDSSSADTTGRGDGTGSAEPGGSSGSSSGSSGDPSTGSDTGVAPITVDGDALPELPEGDDDPAVGLAAPALSGVDFDAQPVSFTPGNAPTLLVFLAHWCPHCNEEIPMMLEWQEAGGQPDGLDIIGVSTAVDPQYPNFPPGEWLAEKEWAWPVIADDETSAAARSFGLAGFPFMVLVDADGNVVARTSGEKDPDQLSEFVAQVGAA